MLRKTLKFLGALLVSLLVLLLAFLSFNPLYRHLPQLVSAVTPWEMQANIQGNFFSRQQWRDFSLRGEGLHLEWQSLDFQLNLAKIWKKSITLERFHLQKGALHLAGEKSNPKTESQEALSWPESIHIPLEMMIHDLRLHDFAIHQNKNLILQIDEALLYLYAKDENIQLRHQLKSNLLDASAELDLKMQDDYPLDMQAELHLKEPQQSVQLHWRQALFKPQLNIQTQGLVQGQWQLQGEIQPQKPGASLLLMAEKIQYADYRAEKMQLQLQGQNQDWQIQGQGEMQALHYPALPWHLNAQINGQGIEKALFELKTPEGSASLHASLVWDAWRWQAQLQGQNILLSHFLPETAGEIQSLQLQSQGQGENLNLNVDIAEFKGRWQDYPLQAQGQIHYQQNHVQISQLNLQLADNRLTANGQLKNGQQADLKVQLRAPQLSAFLPELSGQMEGQLQLRGPISHPEWQAHLNWHHLAYAPANSAPLFSSNQGKIEMQGDLKEWQLQSQLQASGQDVPPLQLKGEAKLNAERIHHMQWQAELLQGKMDLQGSLNYSPLAWNLKGQMHDLKMHDFYPEIQALLRGQWESEGRMSKQGLEARLHLPQISGSWRNETLQAQGELFFKQQALQAKKLRMQLGQNELQLDGEIQPQHWDLDFQLQAPQLRSFWPGLAGAIQAQGKLSGQGKRPHLSLQAQGKALALDGHRIQQLHLNVNSALYAQGNFNNHIQLQDLNLNGLPIKNVLLKSQGLFQKHEINLQWEGEQKAQLQWQGGFKDLRHWQGLWTQFKLSQGKQSLSLEKASPLNIQGAHIRLKDFCLRDAHSHFCINVQKEKELQASYRIQNLDPRSFQAWLPPGMKIQTQLQGEGQMRMNAQGEWRGEQRLNLKPGQIVLPLDNQAPLIMPIKKASLEALLNRQQLKSKAEIDLGKMGQFQWDALIQNLNHNPHIQAHLAAHMDDIGVFRNYIPKVNQLQGQLKGRMSFQGDLAQPQINGEMLLQNGKLTIPEYATELNRIMLQLRAGKSGEIDIQGRIGTPDGDMQTQGKLILHPLQLNLNLKGKDMLVANSKTLKVHIAPDFNIQINPQQGVQVRGTLLIPRANIDIPDTSSAVAISEDVIIVNEKKKESPKKESPFHADIQIKLGNQVYFKNKDVNIRLIGDLNIKMRPNESIRGEGRIRVANGLYYLYGQELNIKRGWVTFSGPNIANPIIDFRASREVQDVEVGAVVSGTARNLSLRLQSEPAMPDSFIISYLLFGRAPDGSMSSSDLLDVAANMAIGQFTSGIAESFQLDVFNLSINGLKAGKNISQDLYVGLNNDFLQSLTQFIARYKFNRRLRLEATASQNEQSLDFSYEYEKD